MLSLKSKPAIAPVTFADAVRFQANGYAPVMARWGDAKPYGPWYSYHLRKGDEQTYGDQALAILTDSRAVIGGPIPWTDCKAKWVAALRMQIFGDRGLAKAVDDLVVSRLRWRDGVETRLSPVRLDNTTRSTLRVFALADSQSAPFEVSPTRGLGYVMPGDPPTERRYLVDYKGNSASWLSGANQFIYSADTDRVPYQWTDGGLLAVKRSELPVIDMAGASALIAEIQALIVARGGELWM